MRFERGVVRICVVALIVGCGIGCARIRLEQRKDLYWKAVAEHSDNAHALFVLGKISLEERRSGRAVDYFQQAIASKSNFAEAYVGLGHAYRERKQYRRATEAYEKALEVNPESGSAAEGLGTCYYALGDYVQAESYLEQALLRLALAHGQAHRGRVRQHVATDRLLGVWRGGGDRGGVGRGDPRAPPSIPPPPRHSPATNVSPPDGSDMT